MNDHDIAFPATKLHRLEKSRRCLADHRQRVRNEKVLHQATVDQLHWEIKAEKKEQERLLQRIEDAKKLQLQLHVLTVLGCPGNGQAWGARQLTLE